MIVEYPKIHTLFKRDEDGTLLVGDFSKEEFLTLRNILWNCYEKVDGIQVRVIFDGKKVTFSGRKDDSVLPENVVAALRKRFTAKMFKNAFDADCREVCLYLECYGKGIKGTHSDYGVDGPQFIMFDVMVHDWWLKREDVVDVADKMNCAVVPLVNTSLGIDDIVYTIAGGVCSTVGFGPAEGVVVFPAFANLYFRNGDRVAFKLKTRDFDHAVFAING